MKKVREKLNEGDFMKKIPITSYIKNHKELANFCSKVIDECSKTLDKYDEEGAQDEADEYSIANNEGRIEIAQEILEMLRRL